MSRLGGVRPPQFASRDEFEAHVSSLPKPNREVDDDPHWVRPTEEVTGRPPVPYDSQIEHAKKGLDPDAPPPLRPIPVENIRQTQHQINLEAVKHYVHSGPNSGKLYDPDGWLGTNHPVVVEHPVHGHVLADGNSRFAAAVIRGNKELQAHVLPRVPAEHIPHVERHAEETKKHWDICRARQAELRQDTSLTPLERGKLHAEAYAKAREKVDELDGWLQHKLQKR